MLKYDLVGGYNIPPRLLLLEKPDGYGTNILYHLPSSVIVLKDIPELKAAAEVLDGKLEELITRVVTILET
jgi:hypothetical protein